MLHNQGLGEAEGAGGGGGGRGERTKWTSTIKAVFSMQISKSINKAT